LERGIGGSELAVIKLADIWSRHGYTVTVFCSCDSPGMHGGVLYRSEKEFNPLDEYDIFIIWRSTELANILGPTARKCFLDLHDLVKPGQITGKNMTVCVKSKFHASLLGDMPDNKVAVIPNGGALEKQAVVKDPNYIIYASSYDRGLAYILKWAWPKIKRECPNAYLNIYYGWNGFDASQPDTEDVKLYKNTILELMAQDGVKECGRISQEELLKEKAKANIHLYTGDFQEIDCISVRESACLGAIPVVSKNVEVFAEKPYCISIEGDPRSKIMQEKTAEKVIEILKNPELAESLRQGPVNETWENTALEWLKLF
jgi:glycosyltransferase involved in cell wall biosynthesis